jgi:hypothetical protein
MEKKVSFRVHRSLRKAKTGTQRAPVFGIMLAVVGSVKVMKLKFSGFGFGPVRSRA